MAIDWESSETYLLQNPKDPAANPQLPQTPGNIWVATSGTYERKWVGLSKEAILTSAKSVNHHLQSTSKDIWIHPLPDFHVGGLGIDARAYLSGAQIWKLDKWSPQEFIQLTEEKGGTLSALVPTQLYDCLSLNLSGPKSLRAVVIGGGALPKQLYLKGRKLGWPLLPSYGLSECASQVATATLDSLSKTDYPLLTILSHISIKLSSEKTFMIKSPSLLTTYATNQGEIFDPKVNGWFTTEDIGTIQNGTLTIYGRKGEIVKINGELVSLNRLNQIINNPNCYLIAVPHERKGHEIHLVTSLSFSEEIVTRFNAQVFPFECIQKVHYVDEIPKNALGKVVPILDSVVKREK